MKHHSKGYWAILISLASFVVLHGIFYFAHETINEAAPNSPIMYRMDRGLEPFENAIGFFHSNDDKLRDALTHIIERVEELETLALQTEAIPQKNEMTNDLLFEISHELENITAQVLTLTQNSEVNAHQALLLHAQSILEHIHSRILGTQITSTDAIAGSWNATLTTVKTLNTQVVAMITSTRMTEENLNQEEFAQRSMNVPTASILPTQEILAEAPENSCGQKLSSCSTSTDCCEDAGLTCQPTINSNGERTRRCMPEIGIVCQVQCEDTTWSTATNCLNTIILPSYQSCEKAEGASCVPLANNSRNTRRCVQ